jgi:hypothetical protein
VGVEHGEQPPNVETAEIIGPPEGIGLKVPDISEEVKAIWFVGGIGSHQKGREASRLMKGRHAFSRVLPDRGVNQGASDGGVGAALASGRKEDFHVLG